MNSRLFSEALGEVGGSYVEAALAHRPRPRARAWVRWAAVAACLCLALLGAADTLRRFDYWPGQTGCGALPGDFADGAYYYYQPHRGVLRHTPGAGSELALSAYWLDDWQVNDYGLYYRRGRSLYVQAHETGERRRLYSASAADCRYIRFALLADGSVAVGWAEGDSGQYAELLLDGRTGAALSEVMLRGAGELSCAEAQLRVGARALALVPSGNSRQALLLEDGESLLPEGWGVSAAHRRQVGDELWLRLLDPARAPEDGRTWLVLRPDGNDEYVTLPVDSFDGGADGYLFYVHTPPGEAGAVVCLDYRTGESWTLETDTDAAGAIHALATDGLHIYTSAPWASAQACWAIVFDSAGRPAGLRLVSADIAAAETAAPP